MRSHAHWPTFICRHFRWLAVVLAWSFVATAWGDAAAADSAANPQENWPQWRGPFGTGESTTATPPTEWSETKNIKWKVKIPGNGSSTPIVWGDQIFIQTAIPTGKKVDAGDQGDKKDATENTAVDAAEEKTEAKQDEPKSESPAEGRDADGNRGDSNRGDGDRGRGADRGPGRGRGPGGFGGRGFGRGGFGGMVAEAPNQLYQFVLMCIDRNTGKTRWEKVACEALPHESHHRDHGFASYSPVTDGTCIIVFFGSRGLYCYDMEGNLKWQKDLGKMRTRMSFGEGSSPALFGNTVVINWDHEGDDFIVAFDKETGDELWRKARDEDTSWSTPLVVEHDGKHQVITSARKVRSYDLRTGDLLWECTGMTTNPIPSPVYLDGIVYATSGFRGSALLAIKLGHEGNLTDTEAILWKLDRDTPYVPSPLLYDGKLYFFKSNNAILSCYNAKTGEAVFGPERVQGMQNVYASPVAAGGKIYLVDRDGAAVVIDRGDKLNILATNQLDDRIDASPAAVGKQLFLRGKANLYCIEEE